MQSDDVRIDEVDLHRLTLALRQRGMGVTVQQAAEARRLLVELAAAGGLDRLRCSAKEMLRPIFCVAPAEVAIFDEVYESFNEPVPVEASVTDKAGRKHDLRRYRTPFLTGALFVAGFGAFVAAVVVGAMIWSSMYDVAGKEFGNPYDAEEGSGHGADPSKIPPRPPWVERQDSAKVVRFQLVRSDPPAKRPWLLAWVAPLAAAGLTLASLLLWRSLARSYALEQGSSKTPHRAAEFTLSKKNQRVAQAFGLRDVGRALRQRRRGESSALDVARTVAATVRAGGFPVARFESQREPRYLVLAERRFRQDHRAALTSTVVDGLRAGGADVRVYWYDYAPTRCHAEDSSASSGSAGVTLSELANRYRERSLLLVADASDLFDRYTGRVSAWTHELPRFDSVRVLTPLPPEQWTIDEVIVETSLRIPVLPLSGEGLARLRRGPHLPHATLVDRHATRRRTAIYRSDAAETDRRSPPSEHIARTLSDLRLDLGGEGFRYLAALAIYPELHWSITLFLGERLFPLSYAGYLPRLANLPWFRRGYLPNWLRDRLIAELPPDLECRVRDLLFRLLDQSALDRPDLEEGKPLAWPEKLRVLLRSGASAPESHLSDAVFVEFLTGQRGSARRLRVPRRFFQALFPRGAWIYGPRPAAAGAFCLALVFAALPVASWIQQSRDVPTDLALNANGSVLTATYEDGVVVRSTPFVYPKDPGIRLTRRSQFQESWRGYFALTPDGARLFAYDAAGPRLWNAETGETVGPPLEHYYEAVPGFEGEGILARGRFALTWTGKNFRLWDLTRNGLSFDLPSQTMPIRSMPLDATAIGVLSLDRRSVQAFGIRWDDVMPARDPLKVWTLAEELSDRGVAIDGAGEILARLDQSDRLYLHVQGSRPEALVVGGSPSNSQVSTVQPTEGGGAFLLQGYRREWEPAVAVHVFDESLGTVLAERSVPGEFVLSVSPKGTDFVVLDEVAADVAYLEQSEGLQSLAENSPIRIRVGPQAPFWSLDGERMFVERYPGGDAAIVDRASGNPTAFLRSETGVESVISSDFSTAAGIETVSDESVAAAAALPPQKAFIWDLPQEPHEVTADRASDVDVSRTGAEFLVREGDSFSLHSRWKAAELRLFDGGAKVAPGVLTLDPTGNLIAMAAPEGTKFFARRRSLPDEPISFRRVTVAGPDGYSPDGVDYARGAWADVGRSEVIASWVGWKDDGGVVHVAFEVESKSGEFRAGTQSLPVGFVPSGFRIGIGGPSRPAYFWNEQGDLALFDVVSGAELSRETGFVPVQIEFEPTYGRYALELGETGTLRRRNLDLLRPGGAPNVAALEDAVRIGISRDGNSFYALGEDRTLRFFAAIGNVSIQVRGEFDPVRDVASRPGSDAACVIFEDGSVQLVSVVSARPLSDPMKVENNPAIRVTASAGEVDESVGSRVELYATAHEDGSINYWRSFVNGRVVAAALLADAKETAPNDLFAAIDSAYDVPLAITEPDFEGSLSQRIDVASFDDVVVLWIGQRVDDATIAKLANELKTMQVEKIVMISARPIDVGDDASRDATAALQALSANDPLYGLTRTVIAPSSNPDIGFEDRLADAVVRILAEGLGPCDGRDVFLRIEAELGGGTVHYRGWKEAGHTGGDVYFPAAQATPEGLPAFEAAP